MMPIFLKVRKAMYQKLTGTLYANTTGRSTASQDASIIDFNEQSLKTLLIIDGENGQVNCLVRKTSDLWKMKNFHVIKLAASCSMNQQPNDAMKSFSIIHRMFNSSKFTFDFASVIPPEHYINRVEVLLEDLEASSKATFRRFFKHLIGIISRAYQLHVVQEGWVNTGIHTIKGLCSKTILSNCSSWRKYTPHDQRQIFDKLPQLKLDICISKSIVEEGEDEIEIEETDVKSYTISDAHMYAVLGGILGLVNSFPGKNTKKDIHLLSLTRWRASIITCEPDSITSSIMISDETPDETNTTTVLAGSTRTHS